MRKKVKAGVCKAAQLRDGSRHPFGMLGGVTALGGGELEVYRQIRNAVPILDETPSGGDLTGWPGCRACPSGYAAQILRQSAPCGSF